MRQRGAVTSRRWHVAKTRRALLRTALGLAALATQRAVYGQPQPRPARIGFLSADASSPRAREAFLQGMREQGLTEGRHFGVDWRFADGRYDRLPGLAAELVRERVDILVAVTTLSVQAAHRATKTIPIVDAAMRQLNEAG